MYQKNLLAKPGGIQLDHVPIDLSDVKIPIYLLSAKEDHIAPWKTCYNGTQLFKGPTRFVLSASGHVAGMLNHPSLNKYCYWTNDKTPKSPLVWEKDAIQQQGSWWNDWLNWIQDFSGKKIPARDPSKGKRKVIEDAPGSYVKVKMY